MRTETRLRSLATQLSVPRGRAVALLRAIEDGTSQSLSDTDLIDAANRTIYADRPSTSSGGRGSGTRTRGVGLN
jgi:hypothetical protein